MKGSRDVRGPGQGQARHDCPDPRLLGDAEELEHWKKHYEAKGYTVLTPAYPGFEVEVEALRADPTPIEQLQVPEIIEMLEN